MRLARETYYKDKFKEYSNDIRKTWSTIRDVIGTKNIVKIFLNILNMEETQLQGEQK